MVMESSTFTWHLIRIPIWIRPLRMLYFNMCGLSTQNIEFWVFLSVTCNTQIETPYLSYLTIHKRIRTPTNVIDFMKRKITMLWICHYSICWFKENFALSTRLFKFQMNESLHMILWREWEPRHLARLWEVFFITEGNNFWRNLCCHQERSCNKWQNT